VKQIWKGVLVAIGVVLLVAGVWKGYSLVDTLRTAHRDKKLVAAAAHHDSATTFHARADTAKAKGAVVRGQLADLVSSPKVQADPIALQVAVAGAAVIAQADTEISNVRSENQQLRSEAADVKSAGSDPGPRGIPYLEPLVRFRRHEKAVPIARAGIDYRLFPHVSAKLELEYSNPGLTVNVGSSTSPFGELESYVSFGHARPHTTRTERPAGPRSPG
jgi:hypothetical protein